MGEVLILKIESCMDCPWFRSRSLLGGDWDGVHEERSCRKATKYIFAQDGILPPPEWCPIRKEVT